MSIGHAEWIGNFSLGHRIWETGSTFMLGETGDIIARPEHPLLAVFPCLLAIVALALAFARGDAASAAPPASRSRSPQRPSRFR